MSIHYDKVLELLADGEKRTARELWNIMNPNGTDPKYEYDRYLRHQKRCSNYAKRGCIRSETHYVKEQKKDVTFFFITPPSLIDTIDLFVPIREVALT